MLKFHLRPQVSHALYSFDLHETRSLSVLYEQPLPRISAKSNERCSNSAEEFNDAFHESMTLTRTIHKELLLPCQLYAEDKAIPLQAWTGPECSKRLRLPDFKTIGT